ncbi:hypothetical protein ACFQ07_07895 [Actinomadura adrarensis]|uniref:Ion transport domain-containing protein n=1 Tax=Actinomadura adrarensis TaxID=1819600 RepID=A0ABW3CEK7_9ACTN
MCTFVVLNLFIAVVVRAMEDDEAEHAQQLHQAQREANTLLLREITALRAEIEALRDQLSGPQGRAARRTRLSRVSRSSSRVH